MLIIELKGGYKGFQVPLYASTSRDLQGPRALRHLQFAEALFRQLVPMSFDNYTIAAQIFQDCSLCLLKLFFVNRKDY